MLGINVVDYKLWVIDRHIFDYIESGETQEQLSSEYQLTETDSFQKTLTLNGKVLVCASKSFRPDDSYTFTSAEQVASGIPSANLFHYLSGLSPEIHASLNEMILFDYVINNTDRHRKNFGFLESESNDVPFHMAPLYDHGLSMFSEFSTEDIIEHGSYLLEYCEGKPFGSLQIVFDSYFRKDLIKVNVNVTSEQLCFVVDQYSGLLGRERSELIKLIMSQEMGIC